MSTERLKALNGGDSMDFYARSNPKCPHCGDEYNIADNEAWSLYAEDVHRVDCQGCRLEFSVQAVCEFSFNTDEQEDDE